MAGNVQTFSDDNFQADVLSSDQVVLVDFWAPWCGPCRMLAPTIDQLATEFEGQARVGKLNTDDNPKVSMEYGVNAIPTVLVFKGGQIVDKFVGVVPKEKLAASLKKQMA